jgi:hypothetical protein
MSDTAGLTEMDSGPAKRHRKHEREHSCKQQFVREGDCCQGAEDLKSADRECRRFDGAVRGNVNRIGVHASQSVDSDRTGFGRDGGNGGPGDLDLRPFRSRHQFVHCDPYKAFRPPSCPDGIDDTNVVFVDPDCDGAELSRFDGRSGASGYRYRRVLVAGDSDGHALGFA